MLLASDGITIDEKWTTVLPSEIDWIFLQCIKKMVVAWMQEKEIKGMPLTFDPDDKKVPPRNVHFDSIGNRRRIHKWVSPLLEPSLTLAWKILFS